MDCILGGFISLGFLATTTAGAVMAWGTALSLAATIGTTAMQYKASKDASKMSGMGGAMPPMQIPQAPKPEAEVKSGEEGIRSAEMSRSRRAKGVRMGLLTQGQPRSLPTLGKKAQMLGTNRKYLG